CRIETPLDVRIVALSQHSSRQLVRISLIPDLSAALESLFRQLRGDVIETCLRHAQEGVIAVQSRRVGPATTRSLRRANVVEGGRPAWRAAGLSRLVS